jgi:hypothetical protein
MKTRLEKLNELVHSMENEEEVRALHNFMIGSLAADTEDKVWDRSLRIAKECVEKYIRGGK